MHLWRSQILLCTLLKFVVEFDTLLFSFFSVLKIKGPALYNIHTHSSSTIIVTDLLQNL